MSEHEQCLRIFFFVNEKNVVSEKCAVDEQGFVLSYFFFHVACC